MNALHQALMLDLVETLSSKLEIEAINSKCLKKIANCFGFTTGGIYEINQYDCYNLKESVASDTYNIKSSFTSDELVAAFGIPSDNNQLFYFNKNSPNSDEYLPLLKLFSVSALAAKALSDKVDNICAFVVFFNNEMSIELNCDELASFSMAADLVMMNITKRIYENRLHFAQTTMESILDNTGIDIYVNDFNTHEILYVNKSMAAPYGGIEKFKKRKCWQVLFPEQNGQCKFCPQQYLADENGEPTKIYRWDYQRATDGSWFRVFSAAFRWTDGRLAHVVSSADITDNKRNEEIIQYMANYDELTKLPNRRMLVAECEKRISNNIPNNTGYVMFMDIDGFKSINDNFGHDAGDEFLVQLSEFFNTVPKLSGNVYRNGGDEFVAVLDGSIKEDGLKTIIDTILKRFKSQWKLKKATIFSNSSIGIACYPNDDVTVEGLLNKADKAMYVSKRIGGGAATFARDL